MSREQHESNSRVDGSVTGEEGVDGVACTNGRARSGAELGFEQDNNDKNKICGAERAAALTKRQLVLDQLVTTEESYVRDLHEIVYGYMKEIDNQEIPTPFDLQSDKIKLVFNNIKDIYDWHRDSFLSGLRLCQTSPADLGPLIANSTKKFTMYYYFCSNKPLSESIINEHYQYFDQIREKLGHRIDLSNLIIKPVQRITKYELLINEVLKETQRAGLHDEVGPILEANERMKEIVKKVNDMIVVLGSLSDFDGELTAQGDLCMQGLLNCSIDASQKQRELQVFLFQKIIIFADIQKAKTQYSSPIFKYLTHLQLNHMEALEDSEYSFRIKSTNPNKPTVTIDCQASNSKVYKEWMDQLIKIQDEQKICF